MKDHWTYYLPEGKRIFRDEVKEIISLNEKMELTKIALFQLQKEVNTKDIDILELAKIKSLL